ncbi:MAG: ANTAR domain-containing response regulator [Gammaproteobacteria bacterium]
MAKILLIDDDRLILRAQGRELRGAGYEVLEAHKGAEALDLAKREKPDLALVDIRLPDITGIEVACELRENLNVYSLFFVGDDDHELLGEAGKAGALGYLLKPASTTHMIPAIEAALHIRGELAQLRDTKERLVRTQVINRHISIAIGIYMERFHVSQIESFEALRAYARSERRKLAEVCEELVLVTDRRNELTNRINQIEKATTIRKIRGNKKQGPRLVDDQ